MTNDSVDNLHPATDRSVPEPAGHGGHGWMMMICCVPMIAIAVALVAAGAVSVSFLGYAAACTAMMFVMMRSMNHGSGHNHN